MGKPTHLAITLGSFLKVEIGERMGLCSPRADLGHLQQMLSHQMRQVVLHRANAQVDARLAKINRLELGMAIGHVQERHIAELGNVIQAIGGRGCAGFGKRAHAHASHRAGTHHLNKFAFREIHICNH